jgi:hypothetical protein
MNCQYLIESIRLTSSASEITFSNIPIQFTHLSLMGSLRSLRTIEIDEGIQEHSGFTGTGYKYSAIRSYGATLDAVNTESTAGNWGLGGNGGTNVANSFGISTSTIVMPQNYGMSPFITRLGSVNTSSPLGSFIVVGGLFTKGRTSSVSIKPFGGTSWVAGSVVSLYGSRPDNKLG